MLQRCAVSIDLDEVHHYHAIHGLAEPAAGARHPVYDIALERCQSFFGELGVPLTLFVVAADLRRSANVSLLSAAAERGQEIGSHSLDHLYDLARRSNAEQREQVEGALALFDEKLGFRPVGFRAPGYTVSDELLDVIAGAGHRYDSSVFPSPPYYAAKAGALALQRLRGRRSRAILDDPRVLSAPTRPYRIGRPYTRRGDGLCELPIQVTPGPRLPYIGTALTMAGRLGARALTELVIGEPFINLELHGIDFLDLDDGLEPLAGYQPDLSIRVADKRRIFSGVIQRLRRAGCAFVRLGEACDELTPA